MTALLLLVALSCYLLLLAVGVWGVTQDYYALQGSFNALTFTWRLYTNNHTPASNDSASNYTELTASGYTALTTVASSWTLTNETTYYQATHANLVYTFTGPATLYGYYVTDGSGNFVGGELFTGGPFTYGSGTQTFTLSPVVQCGP